jgi:hypothetical protein
MSYLGDKGKQTASRACCSEDIMHPKLYEAGTVELCMSKCAAADVGAAVEAPGRRMEPTCPMPHAAHGSLKVSRPGSSKWKSQIDFKSPIFNIDSSVPCLFALSHVESRLDFVSLPVVPGIRRQGQEERCDANRSLHSI